MLYNLIAHATVILLMICAGWIISLTYDTLQKNHVRCVHWGGQTYLILSIIFSILALIFSMLPYLVYIIILDKKTFLFIAFASYCLVFSSVCVRMAITEINFHPEYNDIFDKQFTKNISLISEFSLGVGFLCAGVFSILYCQH